MAAAMMGVDPADFANNANSRMSGEKPSLQKYEHAQKFSTPKDLGRYDHAQKFSSPKDLQKNQHA